MTHEEIIRMAREAGLHRHQHNLMSNPVQHRFSYDGYEENLERFAALVAATEREACAKVCEDNVRTWSHPGSITRVECAAAIRARGTT